MGGEPHAPAVVGYRHRRLFLYNVIMQRVSCERFNKKRSHESNERFYSKHRFYSLDDLQRQLKRYMREYNNTPMRPLGWKSPNEYLANFFNDNV